MLPYPLTNFELKNVTKMNLNLMTFIQEKTYPK